MTLLAASRLHTNQHHVTQLVRYADDRTITIHWSGSRHVRLNILTEYRI